MGGWEVYLRREWGWRFWVWLLEVVHTLASAPVFWGRDLKRSDSFFNILFFTCRVSTIYMEISYLGLEQHGKDAEGK